MPQVNNTNRFNFGIAAIAFATAAGAQVGLNAVPASLELSGVGGEFIPTIGGFSDTPVGGRIGKRSGEGKLVVNECPAWLERIANAGEYAELPASPTSGTVGEAKVISGTEASLENIHTKITASTTAAPGIYYFAADEDGNLEIDAHTAHGRFQQTILEEDFAKDNLIIGTGVSISGVTAFDDTGQVSVQIFPAFTKGDHIKYPTQAKPEFYQLMAWTVAGRGPEDSLVQIYIPRLIISGMVHKFEDNVPNSGAEISFYMLDPGGGKAWWETKKII